MKKSNKREKREEEVLVRENQANYRDEET